MRPRTAAILLAVVLAVTTSVFVTSILQNRATIARLCQIAEGQNAVLRSFSGVLTAPLPVPKDAAPSLRAAIEKRNENFSAAGRLTRVRTTKGCENGRGSAR